MKRTCILTALATLLLAGHAVGQSDTSAGPLIPVLPKYQEAAYGPQSQGSDPFGYQTASPPKPQDQLYIFWFLGQVISYPVDKVEDLIGRWRHRKASTDAGSAYEFNPFASQATRHIPPAPPVTDGRAASPGR